MATASAVSNSFSAPGALMAENFPDVLDARFKFVKRRTFKTPVEGLKYWNVKSTNKSTERHSYVTNAGVMSRNRDVDEMPLANIIQGFDNSYTPLTYRLGIRIEQRLRETDQFNVIDKQMADLMQSTKDTIELYAALPFNTTFNTTVEWTCADGMNLVDSARPMEDPTQANWSNLESAGTPTQAAISTMRVNFAKNTNERGRVRPIKMSKVAIPIDLQDTLITNLGSALKPGFSLNDKNFLQAYGLDYEVWNYLTSTTAWFGFGAKDSNYEMNWYWGVKPNTKRYDVGNNPDVWATRARMVFVTGADRPASLRGNAGA